MCSSPSTYVLLSYSLPQARLPFFTDHDGYDGLVGRVVFPEDNFHPHTVLYPLCVYCTNARPRAFVKGQPCLLYSEPPRTVVLVAHSEGWRATCTAGAEVAACLHRRCQAYAHISTMGLPSGGFTSTPTRRNC